MTSEELAKMAHEINRAFCRTQGDDTQPAWADAPTWQRASAMAGVQFVRNHPEAGPEAQHNSWMEGKLADGWKYGEHKDPEKKEHPCLVKFEDLPKNQQVKDHLFRAVVESAPDLTD